MNILNLHLRPFELRPFLGILIVAILTVPLPAITFFDSGFEQTQVADFSGVATDIQPVPQPPSGPLDNRLFVLEKRGRVMIIKNDSEVAAPALDITSIVAEDGEMGLLSIAFDPNFITNRYIYLYYTVDASPDFHRIHRYTMSSTNPNVVEQGTDLIIMDNIISNRFYHDGGTLKFRRDNNRWYLYLTIGDDQQSADSQDLTSINGSLIRIDVNNSTPANPYTIPPDNPFVGQPGVREEIYAWGFRNPFKMNVDPVTNRMYVNDVGSCNWEEVNEIVAGGNYGWPDCEGLYNRESCPASQFQTCNVIPGAIGPIHAHDHSNGNNSVVGGVFYRGTQFPSQYHGDYFFGDLGGRWIGRLRPNGSFVAFANNTDRHALIDVDMGPNGELYYSDRNGRVYRIRYIATGNQAPVPVAAASAVNVLAGQNINFDGSGSSDNEDPNSSLTFRWDFDDGSPFSFGEQVSHSFSQDGIYNVELTVTDTDGESRTDTIGIFVGNPPTATILTPTQGSLYSAGETISFSGSGQDGTGQNLPASAFTWKIDFHHNEHFHEGVPETSGITSGSHQTSQIIEVEHNVWYRVHLTITDPATGLTDSSFVDVLPRKVTMSFETVPPGLTIHLNNFSATSALAVVGVIHHLEALNNQTLNNQTYQFNSWDHGGNRVQNLTTPTQDTTFTANFSPVVPGAPTASIIATPTNGEEPLNVAFDGSGSTGSNITFEWDFNDGSPLDTTSQPNHTFTAAGDYNVQLTVTDDFNQQAVETQLISVLPHNDDEHAVITASPVTGEAPLSVSFSGSHTGHQNSEDIYSWDFGDGSPAETGQNVTHTFTQLGNITVTLTVTDHHGTILNDTQLITVLPPANENVVASFSASPVSGNAPLQVFFNGSASVGNNLTFNWDFGDGSNHRSGAQVSHTFSNPNTYTVTLTVTDDQNESDSFSRTISVHDPDDPPHGEGSGDIDADPTIGPAPLTVHFHGHFTGHLDPTDTFSWDFGDGSIPQIGQEVTHVFETPSNQPYTVTLTINTHHGDSITVHQDIFVYGGFGENCPTCVSNETEFVPFNSVLNSRQSNEIQIAFNLIQPDHILLNLYDRTGTEVRRIADKSAPQGLNIIIFDGKNDNGNDLSSGSYILMLKTNGETLTKKIVVLR